MPSASVLLVGDGSNVAAALEAGSCRVERVDTVGDATDRVDAATGGPDAGPEVVVADLPDGTGFELAVDVHEVDDLRPVVVVGSEPLAAVAEDAMDAGLAAYVQATDLDADRLRSAVTDAAETYRSRRDRVRIGRDGPTAGVVVRDGTVSVADPSLADLLGVADVADRALAPLVAESDRERVTAAIQGAGEDPETVRFAPARAPTRTVELRLRRSPADGAVVADALDVTEVADRVARLERQGERLDSLLENVPMSIYFKDRRSRHERVSHYITRTDPEEYIMNHEGKVHPHADDLVGKTDFDLYAPDFAERTTADDRRVVDDEEPIVDEIEAGTTSLGEEQYTSTTKAPRYDEDGNVIGLVGVTVDVTDRIEHRRELERQNERLNEFAEVLTHDLRNPLNIAQGYLDDLRMDHDEGVVDECSDALARIEALIDEIRAFVLEGRTVREPAAVDLEAAARDAWSTVDTGNATLEVEGGLTIRADADRLRTLFENLFRNAVEHAGLDDADGDEPLAVRVVASDDGFAVEDDGVGLSSEAAEHAFERGFTTSQGGTGFGLAIVRNIAEAHGWSVGASESEAGGACIAFGDVVRAGQVFGRTIS